MKNTKLVKILTSALAVILLICAMVCVTALAENTAPTVENTAPTVENTAPTVEIKYKNLSYGGTISIAFAVKADDYDAVDLLVYKSEPQDPATEAADYTVANYLEKSTIKDEELAVFLTPGIAPRYMNKQIYAVARLSTADGYVYSDVVRYSITEYAYEVQYDEALADEYVTFGETLISYGDQIKGLLGDTDLKPSDMSYVAIADGYKGTVDGKYSAGIFSETDKITLPVYTGTAPEGYAYDGTWVSNIDGNLSVDDNVATSVSANAIFSPNFIKTIDSYYETAESGTKYDFSTDAVIGEFHHATDGVGTYSTESGALVTSGSAGHAVAIIDKAFDSSKLYYKGAKYVFESDFTFNGGTPVKASDLNAAFIGFLGNTTDYTNSGMFAYDYIKYTDASASSINIYGAEFAKGQTYKICMIYTVGTGMEFYVNGVKQAAFDLTLDGGVADAQFKGFGYYARRTSYQNELSLTFDNVFVGAFDIDYQYESYYGNDNYVNAVQSEVHYYGSSNTDNSRDAHIFSENGKLTFKATEAAGRDTLTFKSNDGAVTYNKGDTYVFEAKISWDGTTKKTSGNDLSMAFIGFIDDTGAGYTTIISNDNMPCYDYLTFTDYNSESGAYESMSLYGVKIARGEEHTVRFEYIVSASTSASYMNVFVDGEYVSHFKLSSTSNLSDATFGGFGLYTRNESYSLDTLEITFENVYLGVVKAE